MTAAGAVAVDTGKYTGRSPKDKYIVQQEPSASEVCVFCISYYHSIVLVHRVVIQRIGILGQS